MLEEAWGARRGAAWPALAGSGGTPRQLTSSARAVEVLTAAGVARQAYGPVAAAVGKNGVGSAVETVFEMH